MFKGDYHIHKGDCIEHMASMPEQSIDLSIFSPPFPSVYAYSQLAEDLGNSDDLDGEAKIHLSFFYKALKRIIKPGRVVVVHVAQIQKMKRSGGQGIFDFRGFNIRLGERAGLIYEYDWCVRKGPQAQAIRTKSRELQFVGLERDRARSRGAMGDYLIKFSAPGENQIAVDSPEQVSRNQWIEWAECTWDVRETHTLNVKEGRGDDDTKHICPLQLDVIDRLVLLYSNPGEIVFSPFAGIGSELYMALKRGRRGYGCEIKDEYHSAALKNMERAIELRRQEEKTLFAMAE